MVCVHGFRQWQVADWAWAGVRALCRMCGQTAPAPNETEELLPLGSGEATQDAEKVLHVLVAGVVGAFEPRYALQRLYRDVWEAADPPFQLSPSQQPRRKLGESLKEAPPNGLEEGHEGREPGRGGFLYKLFAL